MSLECITFSLSNIDWTAVGAIITALMMVATFITVYQNKQQVNELKRQWDLEHTPYLSCQLIAKSDHFLLRILNSSNTTANNVNIKIDSKLRNPKNTDVELIPYKLDELKKFLKTQEFVIPPYESVYFTIWITPYKEIENLPSGHISVTLKDSLTDFGTFYLSPQNFAFASFEKENIGNSIVNAISEVGRKIEHKTFFFK